MTERNQTELRTIASRPYGLILCVGPTGSGKTTTLHALLDFLNKPARKIWTAEDPVEITQEGLRQVQVQPKIGFTFAAAMRAFLRADPDVIMVGEMRDQETAAIGIEASLTGHLVLSTLHTTDAAETINRIVDFFPPHKQRQVRLTLAGSIKGTICQRLVPTADGKGRVAVLEVMVANGRIQQCIAEPQLGGELNEIIADGEYYGMQSFDQHLVKLFEQGVIDMRGAALGASNLHDLRVMLQRQGLVSTGTR